MDLVIRLPGRSPESDLWLAPQVAALAVRHLQGSLAPAQAPSGTSNACQDDPNCRYIEKVVEPDGTVWLIYECEGEFKLYPA